MAPLEDHLVGYLSMFLQLGVLVLLTALAALVRASLGRRPFDGWTTGLALYGAAIATLAATAVARDAGMIPPLPGMTIVYAALEDLAALAFVAALRRERGVSPLARWQVAAIALALAGTAVATLRTSTFFDAYRVHSAALALLFVIAILETTRVRGNGAGRKLLVFAFAALALDYVHVPVLTLLGITLPDTYLGLESYLTMVLDIVLGVAIVVHAADGVRVELESRNAALAGAERALRAAAYTDALCGVGNRAAFVERLAVPPAFGSVAMIDVDGLKAINDRYGHVAGDIALASVARSLCERCGDAGTVYRIGGDEFALLWSDVITTEARARLARAESDLAVLAEDTVAPVRISWGVAAFGATAPLADAVIAADADLYERRNIARRRMSGGVR